MGDCRELHAQFRSADSPNSFAYTAAIITGGSNKPHFSGSFPDFNCANATSADSMQELQINLEVRCAPSELILAGCSCLVVYLQVHNVLNTATIFDKQLQRTVHVHVTSPSRAGTQVSIHFNFCLSNPLVLGAFQQHFHDSSIACSE